MSDPASTLTRPQATNSPFLYQTGCFIEVGPLKQRFPVHKELLISKSIVMAQHFLLGENWKQIETFLLDLQHRLQISKPLELYAYATEKYQKMKELASTDGFCTEPYTRIRNIITQHFYENGNPVLVTAHYRDDAEAAILANLQDHLNQPSMFPALEQSINNKFWLQDSRVQPLIMQIMVRWLYTGFIGIPTKEGRPGPLTPRDLESLRRLAEELGPTD
ncbi:hypothetical protein K402DRAFT_463281 [Aulographum hederae CBS 113979]|uniref:BTB domain-containing protein n=1 Tax=Aulographum hederae CBS 113979 TaxID=1176131 RepID=A0A6G1H124_9PEZI|nr:hypothetical protein K402DRAFT_463281 [Aulographum hederae CBS 113979]